jgi:tetratricopeptide (TPR) repeat protein
MRLALTAAALALVASGCMETTVKKDSHVLTQDEAAASMAQKEKKPDAKADAAPPAPPPPATPEQEIARYRAESEKDPQNPKWHIVLGWTYERVADRSKGADHGMLELAELRYRKGLELMSAGKFGADRYTGPHVDLGRVLRKEGKLEAALFELRRAVNVPPADAEGLYLNADYRDAYYMIGEIEWVRKNVAEAEQAFRLYLKYGGDRDRVVKYFPELIAE